MMVVKIKHYLYHATPTSEKYQALFNEYERLPKDTKVKCLPCGSIENEK